MSASGNNSLRRLVKFGTKLFPSSMLSLSSYIPFLYPETLFKTLPPGPAHKEFEIKKMEIIAQLIDGHFSIAALKLFIFLRFAPLKSN